MTTKNQNAVRANYLQTLMTHLDGFGEDVAQITSNSFNFPIVYDGEEGWVEVVIKMPKEDDGYDKRTEYKMKCEQKAEKAKEAAAKKAAKIAKDEAKRKAKEEKTE